MVPTVLKLVFLPLGNKQTAYISVCNVISWSEYGMIYLLFLKFLFSLVWEITAGSGTLAGLNA